MTWEEEDRVDEDATGHRQPDEQTPAPRQENSGDDPDQTRPRSAMGTRKKTTKKKTRKKTTKKKAKPPKLSVIEGGLPPLPDRRGMEGLMAGLFGGPADDAVSQAQELMYRAWEARDRRRRLALAREALEVSADCADAHVMLAEEAATSLDEAIGYYRQGVEAGERSLGEETFEDCAGHFWGLLETRPYMRARAGLAQCLWTAGQHDEAIAHHRELLRLNPGDNQGIQYTLLACLMELDRSEEALELHRQYADDGTAAWTYSAALLRFRQGGDSKAAREALDAARQANPHVPDLLLGRRRMPSRLPDYVGFGDENEAVAYVADNLAGWHQTPGALDWLRSSCG
jgi:tetratricopeptide (TPR) repeat protein